MWVRFGWKVGCYLNLMGLGLSLADWMGFVKFGCGVRLGKVEDIRVELKKVITD